jgi:cytoskeletal protein RodZ
MEDITKIVPEESKDVKKEPKKRSTLFMVLASILLVLLLGVFGALAYWGYQNYLGVTEDNTGVSESVTPTTLKTAEEKALDQTANDLKADDSLTTDDAEKQADDINNIDISGL